jgi:hypothetical protein
MANVDIREPLWPDATTAGVERAARNCAIAPGPMDSVPTADDDFKGALIYVPGTPDVMYTNLQTPTADTYAMLRLQTNRRRVLAGASYLALTNDLSGALFHCGAAEDFVLPALTAANTGELAIWYDFLITTTATSFTITAAAGDLLTGGVSVMSTTAGGENDAFAADGTDDLIFSMNGTTTGGIIGSWVRFTAAGATQWLVQGGTIGSGTLVTPFS